MLRENAADVDDTRAFVSELNRLLETGEQHIGRSSDSAHANERRLFQHADVFTELAVCRRRLRFPEIFPG
jgi:hypothetical protein